MDSLAAFIAGDQQRAWLTYDGLRLYARKARHLVDDPTTELPRAVLTFDLANMSAIRLASCGQGRLWRLLDRLALLLRPTDMQAVFIEHVINPQLAASLKARGAVLADPSSDTQSFVWWLSKPTEEPNHA